MALVRRWWLFMGLSALLNLAALALVGYFWRSLPRTPLLTPPKMIFLTLLPPVPKVQPPPRPEPPAPKRQPKVKATPLPPAPHKPVKIAPVSSGGGAPRARPKRMPKRASLFHPLKSANPGTDFPSSDKTQVTDKPVERKTDNGAAPADPDPGQAKTVDKGKTNDPTPGTQARGDTGKGQAGLSPGTGGGPGAGAGLFGTHGSGGGGSAPRHIVYVLDISGSMDMTEAKFHGRTRIAQAREELDKQFQTLGDGETFSLIVFSDEVHTFRRELIKPDADTLKAAEAYLDGLEPDGDTNLEGALKAAMAVPGVNVIVVITDGVPRTPEVVYETQEDFDKLVSRIDAADSAHVPIFAYGLLGPNPDGTDDSKAAASFLTQIAADSGGKFVEVKLEGEGR